MNQPPRPAEPALRHSEYTRSSPSVDAQDARQTPGNLQRPTMHDTGAFRTLHNTAFGQHVGRANNYSHPYPPNTMLDEQRHPTHNPTPTETSSRFADWNDSNLVCVVENHVVASSPGAWNRSAGGETQHSLEPAAEPHNMHHRSSSFTHPALATMHASTFPGSRHSSAPIQAAGFSKYDSFCNRFDSSGAAKEFRHTSMRFERTPCKPPQDDPTIAEVESDRRKHVERIYNAMTRGDIARDNEGSTAMKRWVYDANYPSALVEAYAHKVFDAMLEQVKLGFRGWTQNDYVVDERKGEDDDRDVDCAGRLDNIISALEHEKSICENVMSSSNQIRMFVNAPKAYSKRKDQNRVGNGKRPNAKGLVAGSSGSPAKKRRIGGHNRNRSSTFSDLPSSRGTSPQVQKDTTGLPYYSSLVQRRDAISSSPPDMFATLRPAPHQQASHAHSPSFDQLHNNIQSSSMALDMPQAHVPLMASMSRNLSSPFMSPPSQAHNHFLSPRMPESTASPNDWQHNDIFRQPPQMNIQPPDRVDSPLFNDMIGWPSTRDLPYAHTTQDANLFAQHPEAGVCLADVERAPSHEVGDATASGDFTAFWQQQQGVQEFSFEHQPPDHKS
ncbi:hypothetical protein NX059_000389 [Plenodomus lindquistii]|nr:hypothetical protein NX059_000389 [Plenodomus lindquistii]